MALTLTPVLCLLLFGNVQPREDNFLVRFLKNGYLRNLQAQVSQGRWAFLAILLDVTVAIPSAASGA